MSRESAKEMLVHYLCMVWDQAGLKWNGDNASEVESIVDNIVEAAAIEARPSPHLLRSLIDEAVEKHTRDDRRFKAARSAMQGLLAQHDRSATTRMAEDAVRAADLLLAELAKPRKAKEEETR